MNPVDVLKQLRDYDSRKAVLSDEKEIIAAAIKEAITETVQRIAMTIINERRAEIEAACNFGELRDALAAELARQFMASRLMGAPTPFDSKPPYPGTSTGGAVPSGGMSQIGGQLSAYAKIMSRKP